MEGPPTSPPRDQLTLLLLVFHEFRVSKTVKDNSYKGNMLVPAFFSPNYKYFDQLLQTVKNKTTVLILVFKEFLQTSIRPMISVLYAKGYHDFPLKNFCLTVPKNFVEEPFFVSQNFWYRRNSWIRGGEYHDFLSKFFLSHSAEKFRRGTLLICVSENVR